MSQQKGIIKTYLVDKGFGFILYDIRNEIFFHISNINKKTELDIGDEVSFEFVPSIKKAGSNEAINIEILNKYFDKSYLGYLDHKRPNSDGRIRYNGIIYFAPREHFKENLRANSCVVFKLRKSQEGNRTIEAYDITAISDCKDYNLLLETFENTTDRILQNEIFPLLDDYAKRKVINEVVSKLDNEIEPNHLFEELKYFREYTRLFKDRESIKNSDWYKKIHETLTDKLQQRMLLDLWLDDFLLEIDFTIVIAEFLNLSVENKINCLIRFDESEVKNLYEQLVTTYNLANNFEAIRELIIALQSYNVVLKCIKSGSPYQKGISYYEDYYFLRNENNAYKQLLEKSDKIISNLLSLIDEDLKFQLFKDKIIRQYSENYVIQHLSDCDVNTIRIILQITIDKEEFKTILLREKMLLIIDQTTDIENNMELIELFRISHDYLNNQNNIDGYIIHQLSEELHISLWQKGLTNTAPIKFLVNKLLNLNVEVEKELINYFEGVKDKSNIIELIFSIADFDKPILNQAEYYQIKKLLLFLTRLNLETAQELYRNATDNKNFFTLIYWINGNLDNLSFNFKKFSKLCKYLPRKDQILFLKKTFSLIEQGIADINIEELISLLDENNINNDGLSIDYSTEIILNTIHNIKNCGEFLSDDRIFKMIENNIRDNVDSYLEINGFIEKCKGRMIAGYRDSSNNRIVRLQDSYFEVTFPYEESLKNIIKSIPGASWDSNRRIWLVPIIAKEKMLEIIIQNNFNYQINDFTCKFSRGQAPFAISFCEGKESVNLDKRLDIKFYWCGNFPCYSPCQTDHSYNYWQEYTLHDFLRILKIPFVEDKYFEYVSLINKINHLLAKMNCKECGHLLSPFNSSNYAYYRVSRFSCKNNECNMFNKEIYLNHCLNGKCRNTIDSRETLKCNNGWYICSYCGSCCSNKIFGYRIKNLEQTGGSISENVYSAHKNRVGHLEKSEYFCCNCSSQNNPQLGIPMVEISEEIFECEKCNKRYETKIYKLQRDNK